MRHPGALIALSLLLGCNAASIEMDTGRGTRGPAMDMRSEDAGGAEMARLLFERDVLPLLDDNCRSCHAAERTGPAFMAPDPSVYETVKRWGALVNESDPGASRIVTKGEHAGPGWNGPQAEIVRRWLDLEGVEHDGSGEEADLCTDSFTPRLGPNFVDLERLGVPAGIMTFFVSETAAGLFLSEIRVLAGPSGARLTHPTLVLWEGGRPTADPVDRFAGVEVVVGANTSALVGLGSVALVDFPEGGRLSFCFDQAGPYAGTGSTGGTDAGLPPPPPPTSGCSNPALFGMVARPQFSLYCTRCHDGENPTATANLDMTRMDDVSVAGRRLACDQIMTRVDRANVEMSAILRAPDPLGGTMHPTTVFPSTTALTRYRDAVLTWLRTE